LSVDLLKIEMARIKLAAEPVERLLVFFVLGTYDLGVLRAFGNIRRIFQPDGEWQWAAVTTGSRCNWGRVSISWWAVFPSRRTRRRNLYLRAFVPRFKFHFLWGRNGLLGADPEYVEQIEGNLDELLAAST
jgi:hypothetical protein